MQLFLSARNEKEKNEIVKRHFLSPFPFLFDIHRRRPGDTYLFPPIAKLQIISRRNCGTGGEKSDEREREREERLTARATGRFISRKRPEHATRNIRGASYEEIDKESPLSIHQGETPEPRVSINEQ